MAASRDSLGKQLSDTQNRLESARGALAESSDRIDQLIVLNTTAKAEYDSSVEERLQLHKREVAVLEEQNDILRSSLEEVITPLFVPNSLYEVQ